MKRNRVLILLVSAVLLVGAAVLSRCADKSEGPADPKAAAARERAEKVVFPRERRAITRRPPAATEGRTPPRHREASADPIQRAMSLPDGGSIFVEVNAIRHSELVERLLACRKDDASQGMRQMKEQLGIDPLEDVDRMALHKDLFAVSGYFDDLKLPPGAGEPEAYGDGAQLYRMPSPDDPEGVTYLAKVGGGLLVLGENEDAVKAAIDRAEGRASASAPPPLELSKGSEVYGQFGPQLLGELLGGPLAGDPLLARVSEIVTDGTVRMLVDDAVSMSLDFETSDGAAGQDLAKAIGGAIAGLRTQAAREGRDDLAALLDRARVLPQEDGKFGIDLAVPGELVLQAMGCPVDRADEEPTP